MINPSTGHPRVCLVSGSGSPLGLGAAMARAFAREGGRVGISDIASKAKEGSALVAELDKAWGTGTACWVPLDVTKVWRP